MTREEFLRALEDLNVWKRGDERAPHKPLLLLLALGRLSQDEKRLVRYEDVEARLRQLLERFGPPRQVTHPEFPFWHLQTDGIWEIPDRDSLPKKKGGRSVSAATLRRLGVQGELPTGLDQLLRTDPELIETAAVTLTVTSPSPSTPLSGMPSGSRIRWRSRPEPTTEPRGAASATRTSGGP